VDRESILTANEKAQSSDHPIDIAALDIDINCQLFHGYGTFTESVHPGSTYSASHFNGFTTLTS
jgi:hypothetical protein